MRRFLTSSILPYDAYTLHAAAAAAADDDNDDDDDDDDDDDHDDDDDDDDGVDDDDDDDDDDDGNSHIAHDYLTGNWLIIRLLQCQWKPWGILANRCNVSYDKCWYHHKRRKHKKTTCIIMEYILFVSH